MEAQNGDDRCKKHNKENYDVSYQSDKFVKKRDNSNISSLRDEIALTRIMIEEIWNGCSSSEQLFMYQQPLSDLIVKVERLVSAMHKMDLASQNYMDQKQLEGFCQDIINVLEDSIDDRKLLAEISQKIINAANSIKSNREES